MKKRQIDISIITINYNGIKDTCELIDSIKVHIKSVIYEIIVVDNASKNNEAEILKRRYKDVLLIPSITNLGYAGGNNIGMKYASGKYILLINNDTIIKEDTLHYLIQRLEISPEIAGASPKIKFAFPPYCIQFAGYIPLSLITLRNSLIGFGEKDNNQYEQATQTPYIHGAAMMLKKEIIKKVGLMPEIYFLYYEELDWCTKITESGYQLWYEPRCTVLHKESKSTGQLSPLRIFYLTRNRLLYAWRNRKGIIKWEAILYQILIASPKNCMLFLLNKKFNLAKAVIEGNIAFIGLKNKML